MFDCTIGGGEQKRRKMTLTTKITTLAPNSAFCYIIFTLCGCVMSTLGNQTSGCHDTHFKCFEDCCPKEDWFCHPREQRCRECDVWRSHCDRRNESVPIGCQLYCYKLQNPPSTCPTSDENKDSCVPWHEFLATVGTLGTVLVCLIVVVVVLCLCGDRLKPLCKRVCQTLSPKKQDPKVAEEEESMPLSTAKAKDDTDTPRPDHACSWHRASLNSNSSSDPSASSEDHNLNPPHDEIRDDPQHATEGSPGDDTPQPSPTPSGNNPGTGHGGRAGNTPGTGRLPPGGPDLGLRTGTQDSGEGRKGADHSPPMASYSCGEDGQTPQGQAEQAGDNGGRKASAAGFEGGRRNRGSYGDIGIPMVHDQNDGGSHPSSPQQRSPLQLDGLTDNEVSTKPNLSQLPAVATEGNQHCVLATGTSNPAKNYQHSPRNSPVN